MQEAYISWHAPLIGWYALNTDDAAKGCPGHAGRGTIIRDQHSSFISAFIGNFGHCTSFRAKVTTLVSGLDLVHDLQISNQLGQSHHLLN